ncbi:hypothetical protein Baya_12956 [Bagarius yarrelli]|uniref:Uncharacterized protein n=1 Tax=Bagarius yarrelli TaxID=175774 RepID=A0A556V4K4_BAGYA|nr:hypothetical protein Baya_12956 [Bagarius yarrelli]
MSGLDGVNAFPTSISGCRFSWTLQETSQLNCLSPKIANSYQTKFQPPQSHVVNAEAFQRPAGLRLPSAVVYLPAVIIV